MIIQNFSKDAKRGFVAGSNSLTPEKLAAGAVAVASVLAVSAVGGLIDGKSKAGSRAGKPKNAKKRKKALPLLVAPVAFNAAKSAFQRRALDNIKVHVTGVPDQDFAENDACVEIENAITINSEEEVYEHI